MLKYLPSNIAAASLFLAQKIAGQGEWNSLLQQHTQYDEAALRPCATDLWQLVTKENPKYRAVRKKYSLAKYHNVAKIPSDIDPLAQ